jgi:hypothetical protein
MNTCVFDIEKINLVYLSLNCTLNIIIFSNRMEGSLVGELWLEVGSVTLGPLLVEAAMSLSTPEHNLHLVQHR